jgi:glucosamine-6-phosphate deaminase
VRRLARSRSAFPTPFRKTPGSCSGCRPGGRPFASITIWHRCRSTVTRISLRPPRSTSTSFSGCRLHLFNRVNLAGDRINFLNGAATDPQKECARYERAIEAAGGIDVQILGVGTNGHIGFNEPDRMLQARTHRVTLKPETRRANAALFGGDPAAVPAEALSMGMATILQARSIVLLATGRTKAACVERLIHGPITTELPASFLQVHHDVEIMLDEPAAAGTRF